MPITLDEIILPPAVEQEMPEDESRGQAIIVSRSMATPIGCTIGFNRRLKLHICGVDDVESVLVKVAEKHHVKLVTTQPDAYEFLWKRYRGLMDEIILVQVEHGDCIEYTNSGIRATRMVEGRFLPIGLPHVPKWMREKGPKQLEPARKALLYVMESFQRTCCKVRV